MILMFVDITGFSTKMKNQDSEKIKEYLDEYYELILKIIDDHNGTVFQIIGDGILCFWGKPFSENELVQNRIQAINCGKDLIEKTYSKGKEFKNRDKEQTPFEEREYESKVALHEGTVFYHEIESKGHRELNITGKPVTELFRLEAESENNAVNYFLEVCEINKSGGITRTPPNPIEGLCKTILSSWFFSRSTKELKGVGEKIICSSIYQPAE